MNLLPVSESAGPALLGFAQRRWERRRTKLRVRLAKEFTVPTRSIKNREQIETENLAYWSCGRLSLLRAKFAEEAEKARQRWHEASPNRPLEGYRASKELSVTCGEGKDSGTVNCDIKPVPGPKTYRCGICGNQFRPARSDASFCSVPCRKRANRIGRSVGGRNKI